MNLDSLAAATVLARRNKPQFSIETFCFEEQIAFIQDPKTFKTAVCSRRAGKTIACAADLINTALGFENVVCIYITLKRINAKRLIWPEILKINREYQLGGIPNETDLALRFPNGSIIYCSGAKDKSEIENFRGLPIKKVYVDESQSFRAHIEDLIDDVLSKALFDYNGTLCLIGTPGLVPVGYYYNCTQSKAFSHHEWTMFQNPHLEKKSGKTVQELVNADCERMGVDHNHPKIQRECYGRWMADPDSFIFKYNSSINDFALLPQYAGKWDYVIGVDLGHDDADAIAVIGWHPNYKQAYLVEELIKTKQGITELADQLEARIAKYEPLKVVVDSGALGKKIVEEIRRRRALPLDAAEKSEKMSHIEILNDAMRTARFFAKKDSAFAQDCFLVEKDKDKSRVDKIVVSDKYHSDICFVAGTKIETRNGFSRIENIAAGDYVMTSIGPRVVLSAGQTSNSAVVVRLLFDNGSAIECTHKHPIFTENRGFVHADALLYADRCVISRSWQKRKLLNSMAAGSLGILNQSERAIGTIIRGISAMGGGLAKKPRFMWRYGNTTTVQLQRAITSIIKTITPSTMIYPISNALAQMNTMTSIEKQEHDGVKPLRALGISKKSESKQKNGTNQQRAGNGIKIMRSHGDLKTENEWHRHALFAAKNIKETRLQRPLYSIARTDVERGPGAPREKITKLDYARFVTRNLLSIVSQKRNVVARVVRIDELPDKRPVYNLTVRDKPEFYANGVLVHNCDAVLYAYRCAFHWLSEPAKEVLAVHSEKWFEAQAKEAEDNLIDKLEREKQNDMWGDMEMEF